MQIEIVGQTPILSLEVIVWREEVEGVWLRKACDPDRIQNVEPVPDSVTTETRLNLDVFEIIGVEGTTREYPGREAARFLLREKGARGYETVTVATSYENLVDLWDCILKGHHRREGDIPARFRAGVYADLLSPSE